MDYQVPVGVATVATPCLQSESCLNFYPERVIFLNDIVPDDNSSLTIIKSVLDASFLVMYETLWNEYGMYRNEANDGKVVSSEITESDTELQYSVHRSYI